VADRIALASGISACSDFAWQLLLILLMMFLRSGLPFAVAGLRVSGLGGPRIAHLQSISEHSQNALRDNFGTFRADPCRSTPICSHFRAAAQATRNEKANTFKDVVGRSERI
jgi:hypothetical protein